MTTLRLIVALAAVVLAVSASPTSVGTPTSSEDVTESLEITTAQEPQTPVRTTTTIRTTSTTTKVPEVTVAPESSVTPAAAFVTPVIEEDEEKPDDLSNVPEPVSKDAEGPEVYSLHVHSDVKFRYATTVVTSRVVNRGAKAAEITFQFVLPEKAFISGFLIEVREKVYKAYVKEKEEANKVYQAAVEQGHTAAQVAVSARDSNLFAVSVNVEPQTKMTFNLTYEELLTRRLGLYDHIIHLISSDKLIRDMKVEVAIEERQNITTVKVPEPAGNNDIDNVPSEELVKITRPTPTSALVTYSPSLDQQKKLLEMSKSNNSVPQSISEESSTQRLRVQYDVDHHSASGDVLLRDGYFVHFFAPTEDSVEESRKRHKHVIFVLDTSGSMWGRKIQQLQEAMALILDSLNDKGDYFSIVQFSDAVQEWSPLTRESETSQGIHLVTSQNIEKAKKYIKTMEAYGGTNIAAALRLGIQIAARGLSGDPFRRTIEEQSNSSPLPQPLVIFLTDGEPTTGETRLSKILAGTRAMNTEARAPIFSLAFGNDADFRFVRKLSLQNHAFARRIYEAADATLQLESFFQEVSSPLLNNVTFSYINPKVDQSSLTESTFHTYFAGTEVVVAGRVNDMNVSEDELGTTVSSSSSSASMSVSSPPSKSESMVVGTSSQEPPLPPLEPLPLSATEGTEKPVSSTGAQDSSSGVAPAVSPPSLMHDIIIPHPKFPPPRTPEQEIRKPEPGSLERLWAYLTIRQLLDKDLADEEEKDPWEPTTPAPPVDTTNTSNTLAVIGGIIGKEPAPLTPKQKALQLALQYGFVTPLTSLVVVKPPKKGVDSTKPVSSTVTDPLLEGKEKAPGLGQFIQNKIVPVAAFAPMSPQLTAGFGGGMLFARPGASPQYGSSGFAGPPGLSSYPVSGASGFAGSPASSGQAGLPSYAGPATSGVAGQPAFPSYSGPGTPGQVTYKPPVYSTTYVVPARPLPGIAVAEESDIEVEDSLDSAVPEKHDIEGDEAAKHLTIEDIEWYKEYITIEGQLNITQPGVDDELYAVDNRTWRENDTFGNCQTPNNEEGFCRHLSTCVQNDFVKSYTKFIEYFCPIDKMVGVCCPSTHMPPPDMKETTLLAESMPGDGVEEEPHIMVPPMPVDTTEEKIITEDP
ncbi:inter-alpha-trypsin inhibitor heavy chain H4-like isoform X2 [Hetaerina americana]|uniref:inter-alpha-trypsin inhibitor heavy chain H4-like isoform X2 n=1 Tax=Hetaerina americana TaxID=62018 RepID=UPI003A7F5E5B